MWKTLLASLSRPPQPRAWAVRDRFGGFWHKLVATVRPVPWHYRDTDLRGPFRSEVDVEEFCDRCNLARSNRYTLYDRALFQNLLAFENKEHKS